MTRPRPVSPLWDAPKISRAPLSTWPPTTPGSSQARCSTSTAATLAGHAPATDRPPEPHAASGDPTDKKTESGAMKIHLGTLTITSSAFRHGERIPDRYADGNNPVLPALSWTGGPEGTASFAVVVHDPDAPTTYG